MGLAKHVRVKRYVNLVIVVAVKAPVQKVYTLEKDGKI